MNDFLFLMWKPLLACFVLTGIHAYLGIHVVEREVIFVDLALAQIAALGATIGFLFGFSLEGVESYWFSLVATFIGAVIFSLTRTRKARVPQEAIIGVVFAVSAAAAVLVLSRAAEGDEHLRHILVGNILLVSMPEIVKMAILYGVVGLFHFFFRENFLLISTRPEEAFRKGLKVRVWDLLFYLTFGLVVTSSVRIAGVLLVFSFLIVPAIAAILFSDKVRTRLFIGWVLGAVTSLAGLCLSYQYDLPTGATVVCAFGGMLLLTAILRRKN